jgi:CHAD domain-containing protein
MPVDQTQCRIVIEKLDRQLLRVAKKFDPSSVHKVRTYSRRVESLLGHLLAEPNRNHKKLLKLLGKLRKRAGRVRDLDVQMSNLRSLKIAREAGQKSQLQRALAQERGKQARELDRSLDRERLRELRKRLKRAADDLKFPEGTQPLGVTMRELSRLDQGPLTEKTLHQYRIAGKRARYVAEFAGKDPEAERLVEKLKRMQDVIGDWHDWLKLAQRAQELFGGVRDSALVSALQNLTRAKFRQGVDAVVEMRGSIVGQKPARLNRKQPAPQAAAGWNASVAQRPGSSTPALALAT